MISYLHPVFVRQGSGADGSALELTLFRGRYQLSTHDAMYSDGDHYRPLIHAFEELGGKLAAVGNVLVLGTGLGSAVELLNRKGYKPNYTLVDYDKTILRWALEVLEPLKATIDPICADAGEYIGQDTRLYDMVIVDIFNSRVVPDFVITEAFIKKCRLRLRQNGIFVMNFMLDKDSTKWEQLMENISNAFPHSKVLTVEINRIIVATV